MVWNGLGVLGRVLTMSMMSGGVSDDSDTSFDVGNARRSHGYAKLHSGSVPTCQGMWNACWNAFQGGGPRLKVQTACLGDQTRRSTCRKHARLQGRETCCPGGFCQPGGSPGRRLACLGMCQRAWTRCLACPVRPVDTATCPMRGMRHRAGNTSGDMLAVGPDNVSVTIVVCPERTRGRGTRRRGLAASRQLPLTWGRWFDVRHI